MSMLEQFLQDLGQTPDDWALRGVLADWAEDNARPQLAACLRWMVGQRKRPYRATRDRGVWFNAELIRPDLGDRESDIPGVLYSCLEDGTQAAHHRIYPSLRDAEEALFRAWTRACAAGWRPKE